MNHHSKHHPDVTVPSSAWSEEQHLHVAACYSNPFRWRTRRELANDFRRHMAQSPNVDLHFIELAYGDRPFEVTDPEVFPNDIQVRARHELFHKENLLGLAIRSFPPNWRYGAIIDADFHFTRHDYAIETIHQLQMYDWVQMFSTYTDLSGHDLGKGHRVVRGPTNGFVYNYVQNDYQLPPGYTSSGRAKVLGTYSDGKGAKALGATGGAWAFRRSALDTCGGLLDRCILGSGDWFMALGLVSEERDPVVTEGYTSAYLAYIEAWQGRAAKLKKNIGYVDCHAIHNYHGSRQHRGYSTRNKILVDNTYDPIVDVHPDWQGVLQLTGDKPRFRDEIRRYFLSRSEDYHHEWRP